MSDPGPVSRAADSTRTFLPAGLATTGGAGAAACAGASASSAFSARFVTFAPGTTTAIVAADLLGSQPLSSTLTFMLALSNPVGGTLVNTAATASLIPASVGTSAAVAGATVSTPPPSAPSVLVTPTVTQNWVGGFSDAVTLTNDGSQALSGWEVAITTPDVITNLWNAVTLSHTGDTYIIGSESYNGSVAVHGSASFGFQAEGSPAAPLLAAFQNS